MTEPKYDQGKDYGGPMARHSEYRPGEQAGFEGVAGQIQTGEVLHVSDGPGGQIYIVANDETGFPDVLLAGEIAQPPEQKNEKQR